MSRRWQILEDDLQSTEVVSLLSEHLDGMARHSPPESIHALDLDTLRGPDITFWTVWNGAELLGCGALRELHREHGEIKSMRTASAHLGKGVASQLLQQIISSARSRGYHQLSLETGSGAAFEAAHSLYQKFGFEYCGPFGDYREDPFSRCMTLRL